MSDYAPGQHLTIPAGFQHTIIMPRNSRSDHVLPTTRWLAAIVVPFLIGAFVILYLLPAESGRLFAWPIRPAMSARMLASAYAGGIYFFWRVVRARQWHHVKAGFPPVAMFAAILGVATILHWDRFTPGHPSFVLWAALYFTTPFVVTAAWLANRRTDPHTPDERDVSLSYLARLLSGAVGLSTLIISGLLFARPEYMIAEWPWMLTPLTSRVLSAMFSLPGLVGLGIALDARWSAARVILQAQSVALALILLATTLNRGDLDPQNLWRWPFVAGLAVLLLGNVLLFYRMERRARLTATQTHRARP